MKSKRFFSLLIACVLVMGCLTAPAGAVKTSDPEGSIVPYVTAQFEETIPGKSILPLGDSFSLEIKETISYNCTYTPSDASIKFGFIAPDGLFYGLYGSNGSIDKTIRVSQRGSYTLAIKNYSDVTVTVTGTVNY